MKICSYLQKNNYRWHCERLYDEWWYSFCTSVREPLRYVSTFSRFPRHLIDVTNERFSHAASEKLASCITRGEMVARHHSLYCKCTSYGDGAFHARLWTRRAHRFRCCGIHLHSFFKNWPPGGRWLLYNRKSRRSLGRRISRCIMRVDDSKKKVTR